MVVLLLLIHCLLFHCLWGHVFGPFLGLCPSSFAIILMVAYSLVFCGYSSRCRWFVCSVGLWYFLIILFCESSSHLWTAIYHTCYNQIFKDLASHCSRIVWFESTLASYEFTTFSWLGSVEFFIVFQFSGSDFTSFKHIFSAESQCN